MTAGSKEKRAFRDLASGLVKEGRSVRIEASGYSMYPTIKPGNRIYIEEVKDSEALCPGDIIAWQREDDIVVHRLVHRYLHDDDYYFISRGDSSRVTDMPVAFDDIIGVVSSIEAGNGKRVPARKELIRERQYWINSNKVWFLLRYKAVLRRVGLNN